MPFTLAHPAAVLPLRRTRLPFAALVVGSMVPDVPLFTPAHGLYERTHSLVGIVTVDVLIGLLGWLAWTLVLRDALIDSAPAGVRTRLPRRAPAAGVGARGRGLLDAVAVVGALVAGAVTHVVWDEFTHPGRWGQQHVRVLSGSYAGVPAVSWAQYASGVVGLVVLVVVALRALGRTPAHAAPRRHPRFAPWVLRLPLAAALGVVIVDLGLQFGQRLHDVAFAVVTDALGVLAVVLALTAFVWRALPGRRS